MKKYSIIAILLLPILILVLTECDNGVIIAAMYAFYLLFIIMIKNIWDIADMGG